MITIQQIRDHMNQLVRPHGGLLIDRTVSSAERAEVERLAEEAPRLPVDRFTAMDALNIAIGAYSPLLGFMGEGDYRSVIERKTLAGGATWTVPILLHVPEGMAAKVRCGQHLTLIDSEARPFALQAVESVFELSKRQYAELVFGTADHSHPGVDRLGSQPTTCVGGPLTLLREPDLENRQYFFRPSETRKLFVEREWKTVAAFHTRNVPHRAHEYLQKLALEYTDGLFVHPIVGWKKAGDFSQRAQFETYEALFEHYYPRDRVLLGGFYCQVRYAGPREAVFHAIVRQNFGCSHIIIGRDHAGVGRFYGVYDSHQAFEMVHDLEITPLRFAGPFYCRRCGGVVTERTCPHGGDDVSEISGTLVRKHVVNHEPVPQYLLRQEVLDVLERLATDEAFVR
jgi:sulfate adenylyltransferase